MEEVVITNQQKEFFKENGYLLIEKVVDDSDLQDVIDELNYEIDKRAKELFKDGEIWRAYVLVEYPIGAANNAFVQQIKKQEELYTRFRSSETFKELEDEVKKYEEWKEKQKLQ